MKQMEREEWGVRGAGWAEAASALNERVGFWSLVYFKQADNQIIVFYIGAKGPARELAAALVYQRHF